MIIKKIFVLFVLLAIMVSLASCAPKPSVSNFYMAKDDQGTNKTTTFAQTDAFNLFFDVGNVPSGTTFETRWYVLNSSSQDPTTPFQDLSQNYDGTSTTLRFHLTNTGNWPVSQYRVDIYESGNQIGQVQFSVSQ